MDGNLNDFLKNNAKKPQRPAPSAPVNPPAEQKKSGQTSDQAPKPAEPKKVQLPGGATTYVVQPKPIRHHGKRYTVLSDGTEIELDDLKPEETQASQKRFNIVGVGKLLRHKKAEEPKFFPPALPLETPSFLNGTLLPFNERQRKYKQDFLTDADLNKESPAVTVSKNPLGWSRYIFCAEVKACKNGFLYYTVPLLLNIVFLLLNAFKYNFLANILFSVLALLDILAFRATFKADKSVFVKVLICLGIIAGNFGIYFLGRLIPGLYDLIYLPYTIKLLFIIFCIYYFGKFYALFALTYYADCNLDFGNTVQINAGKPRSGKTSSAVQDSYVLALLKWKELQYDYMIYMSREKKILKNGSIHDKLLLNEIKISYNFYIMRPCIPCLWGNIGTFDKNGRASHVITLEHLKGIKRLPLYSVVVLDEIGAMLKPEDGLMSKGEKRPLDISDMFRLGGHFLKWCVIGCEQDFNHIYIDCRRVVGFNKIILGQEWVGRPTVLYGIFKFLKWLAVDGLDKKIKKSPKYAEFLYRLEKFCKSIGFRRIQYTYTQNTETGATVSGQNSDVKVETIGRTRVRFCPSNLVANYDDRAYKQLYPSYFDKKIEGELHQFAHIDGFSPSARNFVNTTAEVSEKRVVLDYCKKDFKQVLDEYETYKDQQIEAETHKQTA